ncbi:RNA polymerase sigma-70 factor, ECF subfamily [Quadrisphaera granulorum]|uniref:RNA polymerase sigma-70 factor (ECF subfamily) n=1 Tax=Quadrisphaera granulorum TaxID=317664 RepID=A0A315ZTZ9_9ACTN|nr:sigma-70 family RNA polymerase sigma factor [Quadrisphaera granulorum]PWJ49031.1 RNA polymerase sigma-70 factor (ECF subfamily) [Quadrisphaera granulorum]SZE98241.1 RNA polymerase sigma-70 factor, ECF subfamily [Quadrisphaera granulorum]
MSPPQTPDDAEQRFRALYADVHADVLRFVRRRSPAEAVSSAEDVVADAMLVAWRRFDDAPRRLDAQRAWVFGIARNCLLTARRGSGRREALAVRVSDATEAGGAAATTDPHDDVVAGLDLAAAWRRLSPAEQEVLALTVFEDLTSVQAALVLGTTPTGYRLRLMRARRALRSHLSDDDAAEPAPRPNPHALEATR